MKKINGQTNELQQDKRQKGFTLIELMIVVSIIAIILAIALPQYQRYVIKSKRRDGAAGMMEFAKAMERKSIGGQNYMKDTDADGIGDTDYNNEPPDGFYPTQLPITGVPNYNLTVTTFNNGATYLLTATAINTQVKDAECMNLTITSAGVKAIVGGDGSLTPQQCWRYQ